VRTVTDRFWSLLDAVVDWLSILLLLAIVVLSFVAVLSRYLLNDSLTWSEELTRYLFIWVVFLGSAICVRMRAHIVVDLFADRQIGALDTALIWLERMATLAFAALIAIPGWAFVSVGMSNLSPALEIPMGLVYAGAFVGAVLMGLYVFRRRESSSGAPAKL
jgi:TRAP-type transport system small permease protein